MPISLSAKKSLRQATRNRKSNLTAKKSFKLAAKKYLVEPTQDGLNVLYGLVDKLTKINVFHKNKASRLKSKYSRVLKGKPVEVVVKKKTAAAKKKAVLKSVAAKRKVTKKM